MQYILAITIFNYSFEIISKGVIELVSIRKIIQIAIYKTCFLNYLVGKCYKSLM